MEHRHHGGSRRLGDPVRTQHDPFEDRALVERIGQAHGFAQCIRHFFAVDAREQVGRARDEGEVVGIAEYPHKPRHRGSSEPDQILGRLAIAHLREHVDARD